MQLQDRYDVKVYQAGLKFVLYVACKRVLGADVLFDHSLDKGLYIKVGLDRELTERDVDLIRNEMNQIIGDFHPINRKMVVKKDAYNYYLKHGELEKAGNVNTVNYKTITLYELMGFHNYFMSDMPDTTGVLKKFNLMFLGNNDLLLSHPVDKSMQIPEYQPQDKIFRSFKDYHKWCSALGVYFVDDLNKIISSGKVKDFIMKNDIMMNNEFYNAALKVKESGAKLVLLGGPSSSGKTTSTKKLALYLSTFGYNPIYLGLDDYYQDRENCPKDENGDYDFECLEAIDVRLFNEHLNKIISGEEVEVPHFNFIAGKKEYPGRKIKLEKDDIILIEGLHCLNEELTKDVQKESKVKIYVSPFTPLNIDRHNHVSTIDIRLIRRMIRDSWARGTKPEKTLKFWDKVRKGETKYVFPFTTQADIILNTAYIYEIGVLRVYGEPLLHSIPPESEHYKEVRRILDFMQMFLPIPGEFVSKENILREFIGGSYFDERS